MFNMFNKISSNTNKELLNLPCSINSCCSDQLTSSLIAFDEGKRNPKVVGLPVV